MGITWSPGVREHEIMVGAEWTGDPLSFAPQPVTRYQPQLKYYEEGAGIQIHEEPRTFTTSKEAMDDAFRVGCNLWDVSGMLPTPAKDVLSMSHKFPSGIRPLYEDAHRVSDPRSACLLLRAVCEDLCREKGVPGNGLHEMIGNLESAGASPRLVKALDAIRVIGNNAAHGGKRNYNLEKEQLLEVVHIIVEEDWKDSVVESTHDAVQRGKGDS